jgi:threonine dehydrogenase-like Zn-dependent dehydrogenase
MNVVGTASPYDTYRGATGHVPRRVLAWNVYGTGIERVGRDGKPELVEVPSPGPDQLLVRVDAVGLCFSDVKLIRLGGDHPKLYGRDLEREPTRLGHEASVTVMAVGDQLTGRFRSGQRLAIQPDIYVGGRSTAYGYTIPGGLIEYHLIGPEVLAADDGAYVVEVDDRLGYAETALTEPWACVEAAYTQRRRLSPLSGGRALVLGVAGDDRPYRLGSVLAGSSKVVVGGASDELVRAVRAATSDSATTTVSSVDEALAQGPFDDIVMLGPHSAVEVARAADALAFRGMINLVADEPLDGKVEIDIGRIHYHYTAYVGTTGLDVAAAYGEARNRAELRPDGVTVVVGAGGPMGQMHLERALSLPGGPRLVIGVDLDAERLAAAKTRLEPVATARRRELVMEHLGPEPDALAALVRRYTGGKGADDVVVTAPSARAVVAAAEAMAPDGMLVLFAGVPVGTRAALDLSPVFLHGAQYTGTSGSRIADQALVVEKTLGGQLEPRRALAAVGGIEAARDAIEALVEGRFPGKIVIFPPLRDLPLTPLDELSRAEPDVAAALDASGAWTTEAEARLFARHLPVSRSP